MGENHKDQGNAKRFQLNFILFSLGYIVLGVLRIVDKKPDSMLICYLLGCFALLGGLVRMAFFFLKPSASRLFRNDLAIGVLLLFAGLYCILKPQTILALLPVVLGFGILFDSVLKMEYSVHLRRAAFSAWSVLIVLAMVSALCGILLVLGSFKGAFLFYFMGSALIFDGLLNLLTLVLLSLMLRRKLHPGKPMAGKLAAAKPVASKEGSAPKAPPAAQDPDPVAAPLPGPASPSIENETGTSDEPAPLL